VVGALEAALLAVNLPAAAVLAWIAFRLARVTRMLGLPLDPALAFASLSLGHIAAGAAPLAPDREAFTLYVASSALTASGLIILQLPRLRRGGEAATPLTLPLAALPAAGDAAATAAGAAGAALFRGPARLAAALYAAGHAARLASILLMPAQQSATLLALGETLRALAAASLAAAYTPKPLPRGSREQ